jgi:hypothetical protein
MRKSRDFCDACDAHGVFDECDICNVLMTLMTVLSVMSYRTVKPMMFVYLYTISVLTLLTSNFLMFLCDVRDIAGWLWEVHDIPLWYRGAARDVDVVLDFFVISGYDYLPHSSSISAGDSSPFLQTQIRNPHI